MKIIVENKAHSAFNVAAEEFKKYYNAITERQAVIVKDIADRFIKMPLQDMKPELSNFNSVCEELLTFF